MGTICQACGYERKPTDEAPDWECPSCGKAYIKTSHASNAPSSGTAQGFASEPGSRLHEGLVYPLKPSRPAFGQAGGSNGKYSWVLGIALALFLVIGIPILSNPSSASAILLHGDVGFLCITLLVMMGIVVVFRRMKVDANNPMAAFSLAVKFFGLIFLTLFIVFAVWLGGTERSQIRIQRNGQRAEADVVHIYNGSCGKRSCSIDVEYAFTPTPGAGGASPPVHGYDRLGSSDRANDPNIVYARTNKHVPIAYEVGHPDVSALNFNDDVFRLDHAQRFRTTVAFLGKIFLGGFLLVVVICAVVYGTRSGKATG